MKFYKKILASVVLISSMALYGSIYKTSPPKSSAEIEIENFLASETNSPKSESFYRNVSPNIINLEKIISLDTQVKTNYDLNKENSYKSESPIVKSIDYESQNRTYTESVNINYKNNNSYSDRVKSKSTKFGDDKSQFDINALDTTQDFISPTIGTVKK